MRLFVFWERPIVQLFAGLSALARFRSVPCLFCGIAEGGYTQPLCRAHGAKG